MDARSSLKASLSSPTALERLAHYTMPRRETTQKASGGQKRHDHDDDNDNDNNGNHNDASNDKINDAKEDDYKDNDYDCDNDKDHRLCGRTPRRARRAPMKVEVKLSATPQRAFEGARSRPHCPCPLWDCRSRTCWKESAHMEPATGAGACRNSYDDDDDGEDDYCGYRDYQDYYDYCRYSNYYDSSHYSYDYEDYKDDCSALGRWTCNWHGDRPRPAKTKRRHCDKAKTLRQ